MRLHWHLHCCGTGWFHTYIKKLIDFTYKGTLVYIPVTCWLPLLLWTMKTSSTARPIVWNISGSAWCLLHPQHTVVFIKCTLYSVLVLSPVTRLMFCWTLSTKCGWRWMCNQQWNSGQGTKGEDLVAPQRVSLRFPEASSRKLHN